MDVHIVESTFPVHDNIRRLTTIEMCGDFSMLFLTLVTTAGGFALARSRTTTSTDTLVVRGGIVGERGKDGGGAGGLGLRGEEGHM